MTEAEVAKNILLCKTCPKCIHADYAIDDEPELEAFIMTFNKNVRCNSRDFVELHPADTVLEIFPSYYYGDDENKTELSTKCPEEMTCEYWEG